MEIMDGKAVFAHTYLYYSFFIFLAKGMGVFFAHTFFVGLPGFGPPGPEACRGLCLSTH